MVNGLKPVAEDLRLTAWPSQWLIRTTLLAHLLALVACVANALPLAIKIALLATVVGLGWAVVKQLRAQQLAITYSTCSGWAVNEQAITVLAATTVSQFAIFLQFAVQNNQRAARQSAIICCDAVDGDDFRQLLSRLKVTFPEHSRRELQPDKMTG